MHNSRSLLRNIKLFSQHAKSTTSIFNAYMIFSSILQGNNISNMYMNIFNARHEMFIRMHAVSRRGTRRDPNDNVLQRIINILII
jgi:hypothetical protein